MVILILLFSVWVGELFFKWSTLYLVVNFAFYLLCIFILARRWRRLHGSQWAIALGLLVTLLSVMLATYAAYFIPPFSAIQSVVSILSNISFPVGLLVYVAMRFREINRDVVTHAQRIVQLSEEKRTEAIRQQERLEEEVQRQTKDLRQTLSELKSTQTQLIQSEKMASLGELTAGIAHEIQNPLNFVNNFSEVNTELVNELKEEAKAGNTEEVLAIASDLDENLQKIAHHGKRADAIVKNMLQHSRKSTGKKEPTDINALADEYLRLSYHGFRAKDKSFNATFRTEFDNSLGRVDVIPQDIGRVLLNLFNNAFYAVTEKNKKLNGAFEPTVEVRTEKSDGKIKITVNDNGTGIPQKVLDKIFQPFFTTKPTGEGTGLGLSLSYDIITKAHGGEMKVETKEGEGTAFIIQLNS
ncbi:MAG: two-component sensor histidine kinase [Chitinophagaceae bacterium]|nr:two-component sensor histidine kinase [Chitinophagaceae bacterium]